MTVTLELEKVRADLVEIVKEKGVDYVYPRLSPRGPGRVTCHYIRDGATSCLIGCLLHKNGVPLETLSAHEGMGVGLICDVGVFNASTEVVSLLVDVQNSQDNGYTWGEALSRAGITFE